MMTGTWKVGCIRARGAGQLALIVSDGAGAAAQ